MLLECPRCHFKQPQDQYCANCGVDMLAYKPTETPKHIKVFRSGIFQFFIILILGLTVSYAVVQTDSEQQWIQKINRFAGFKNSKTTTNPRHETVESSSNSTGAVKALSQEPPPSTTQSTFTTSQTTTQNTKNANLAPSAQNENQMHINIQMIEINREQYEDLIHKASDQRSEGDLKTALISNFKNLKNIEMNTLRTEKLTLEPNQSKYLWIGNKSSQDAESMGLNIGFLVKQDSNKIIHVDGFLGKKHVNDNLKLNFKLPKEKSESLIIAGKSILNYFEFESELHDIPPYQIFKSENYKNENSIFMIVIDINN